MDGKDRVGKDEMRKLFASLPSVKAGRCCAWRKVAYPATRSRRTSQSRRRRRVGHLRGASSPTLDLSHTLSAGHRSIIHKAESSRQRSVLYWRSLRESLLRCYWRH